MQLPQEKILRRIFDLEYGQSAYIVISACWATKESKLFIDTSYSICTEKTETFCLKVTRLEKGYVVHIDEDKFVWPLDVDGFRDPFSKYAEEVYAFKIPPLPTKNPRTKDGLMASLKKALEEENYEYATELRNEINNINPG